MRKEISYTILRLVLSTFGLILFCTTNGVATPGDLDPTFGVGGKAIDGSDYDIYDVKIQADGKIVTVGMANGAFLTARYNVDGSPDGTFGTGGRVVTGFGTDESGATAAAIQADGKIVVVGWKCECFDWGNEAFVVIRYNTDGSLDASFDGDGIATTKVGLWPTAWSVVIQPDNKILVGGFTWERFGDYADDHFALARYNPDGSLDTTFDGDGKVITKPSACGFCNDDLSSIALQPDGKVVATGGIFALGNPTQPVMIRYNAGGSLDTAFHFYGNSIDPTGDPVGNGGWLSSVTTQADGKILAAATWWNGTLVLARLNSDGTLDNTFDFDGTAAAEGLNDSYIAIQPNGKILLAGTGYNGSNRDFKIVRYDPNGSSDTTFGGGDGESTVDFGGTRDDVVGIALDHSGRAVVVGRLYDGNSPKGIGIARFLLGSPPTADFDGDGRSDISVFRPTDRIWYLNNSQTGFSATQFGLSTDQIAPGDYDGDGKADIAVWRPSSGTWFIQQSTAGFTSRQWGVSTDLPVPGDYDDDGKTDIAVWRPSTGVWFVINSNNGQSAGLQFGLYGDRPIAGDYDGDGKTDLAVYRPSTGTWYLMQGSSGFKSFQFGISTDKVVPADYDGDGKTDISVYRDGSWYLQQSAAGFAAIQFGTIDDIPVPADYDGDGKADISVWRPLNGTWYELRSSSGFTATQFGLAGDQPVPPSFVPAQ